MYISHSQLEIDIDSSLCTVTPSRVCSIYTKAAMALLYNKVKSFRWYFYYLPKEIHAAVPISFGLSTAYNPY